MTEKEQQQIFDDWLHQYQALIFKVVRAYALNAMDRDDLFQEISIQLWHSVPAFRQESSVSTWLYRVSLNTAIKWVKKERKHQQPGTFDHGQYILKEAEQPDNDRLEWLYQEIYGNEPQQGAWRIPASVSVSLKLVSCVYQISPIVPGIK